MSALTSCTLVTAYYPVRSKFPKQQYLVWASNYMKLHAPIVLFTCESMADWFRETRGSLPMHLVVLPHDQLSMWRMHREKWIHQWTIDPEKHRHSPELYAVWAEKCVFVERAVLANPFHTDYFMWCDIGCFRTPVVPEIILRTFPTTRYFEPDRILFQGIHPLDPAEWKPQSDGICSRPITHTWNPCYVVGGLWGGGARACVRWKQHYEQMLDMYFRAGRFAGKDQPVMLSTYLHKPSLARFIKCTIHSGIDPWFFMQSLLSETKDVSFELDPTYYPLP